MRIAVFSNTYLPTVSGVVRSVSSFKAALEKLGHEIHVFTQGARGYQDHELNVHRYRSFYLGLPNDLPITIPFSPTIDRLLRELKPDVIHSQHPVLLGNLARTKARQLGVPLVYTLHAQYWRYGVYMPFRFLEQTYNKFAAQRVKSYANDCDHIVAPSESLKTFMLDEFKIEKPITVIPTGVNLQDYDLGKRDELRKKFGWGDEFVIISTGRLAPEKNWPDLIRAMDQVIRSSPGIRLVVLGDGTERSALVRLSEELHILSKVEFVGMVPYENVSSYLLAADLFALTSLTETQGLVTLEALAAGLPVVAYDGIGTRDLVVDGVNGRLTEASSEALGSAIRALINDRREVARLRAGALDAANKMDIQILAKDLIRVYETSISQYLNFARHR
jgi:1,2-diacylglycerol 3-alpha-glucosyltransferase